MVDQEVFESQVKVDRFPFPSEGEITLAVRNANYALGPVMLHIGMKAGAVDDHRQKTSEQSRQGTEKSEIHERRKNGRRFRFVSGKEASAQRQKIIP